MMKRLIILVSFLTVTACSSTQFFYDRLDWMVTRYVDQYISLNDAQKGQLKGAVNEVKRWHREKQLPLYIDNIDYLFTLKPSEANAEKVQQQYQKIKDFSTRLATQSLPHLYALFITLNQDQADELFDSLQKQYQEEYEDYQDLSETESREKSRERLTDSLEYWIGDLTPEQIEIVKQWSVSRPLMAQDWFKQQLINKSELQVLFLQRNDSNDFQQKFMSTSLNPETFYSESLSLKLQQNQELTFNTLAQVIQGMTPNQLEHYHGTLRDWREIFVKLQDSDSSRERIIK